MARKKAQKKRGSREHGRGRKAGRGAGLRGGRGRSGSWNHRFVEFYKKEGKRYFGGHGFTRHAQDIQDNDVINVGDLDGLMRTFEQEGLATTEGETIGLDLRSFGIDRLLGSGQVTGTYRVEVDSASSRAVEKIEAAGGEVVTESE